MTRLFRRRDQEGIALITVVLVAFIGAMFRSEERRVGKECRL